MSLLSKHDRFTSSLIYQKFETNIWSNLAKNGYILRILDEWFERAYLCPLIASGWTGAFVGWIWLGRGHNLRRDFYSFIKGQGCEHF